MMAFSLIAAALTIVAKTGMAPGDNPLAVSPIDGLKGPVEVTAADGSKVPCAVRTDGDGRRFVAFRLGEVEILQRLEFRVSECAVAGKELEGVPKVLPGMNLFTNPDLTRRDESGDPVGWWPSPGYGQKKKWTDENRADVKVADGKVGFQNGCWVTYLTGLEEGHAYRLSFDAISQAKRAGLTIWYCGKDGRWPSPLPGVGNYKCSNGIPKTGSWTHIEQESFIYLDKASKRHIFNNTKLLPGTGAAYVQIWVEEGRVAVRNLRYEDVTLDTGIKTEIRK